MTNKRTLRFHQNTLFGFGTALLSICASTQNSAAQTSNCIKACTEVVNRDYYINLTNSTDFRQSQEAYEKICNSNEGRRARGFGLKLPVGVVADGPSPIIDFSQESDRKWARKMCSESDKNAAMSFLSNFTYKAPSQLASLKQLDSFDACIERTCSSGYLYIQADNASIDADKAILTIGFQRGGNTARNVKFMSMVSMGGTCATDLRKGRPIESESFITCNRESGKKLYVAVRSTEGSASFGIPAYSDSNELEVKNVCTTHVKSCTPAKRVVAYQYVADDKKVYTAGNQKCFDVFQGINCNPLTLMTPEKAKSLCRKKLGAIKLKSPTQLPESYLNGTLKEIRHIGYSNKEELRYDLPYPHNGYNTYFSEDIQCEAKIEILETPAPHCNNRETVCEEILVPK